MRKFIKNKAHPSLVLVDRSITKAEWKEAWGEWRSMFTADCIEQFVGTDFYYICGWVSQDRNQPDPLLVKSASLAINIEYSQMGVAA